MKSSSYFYSGNFGIERETLRVDKNGGLAKTPHIFDSDNITRDFCENQIEIVTPVCSSIREALESLAYFDRQARERIAEQGEKIWLYSNPPHFETESDIPIALFDGELTFKQNYREKLQRRYGKRLMLFSGIHFNFSLDDRFIQELHSGSDKSLREFTDSLYIKLYKQLSIYSWLIVLLTASSPYYDLSLDKDYSKGVVRSKYSSMRNSERGYWNEFVPVLDYSSIENYAKSVENYVNKGALFSASEIYLPVRLKPKGDNSLEALVKGGVNHIELRMFDLNPLEPLGISEKDLEFTHLLILYLISLDDFDYTPELQVNAVNTHKNSALYDITDVTVNGINIKQSAENVFQNMRNYFSDNSKALSVINYESEKLSGKRICEQITEKIYL